LRRATLRLLSVAACLAFWQAASVRKWNAFVRFENVPAPTEVAASAARLFRSPLFFSHVSHSLRRVLAGYLVAALAAVPLGLLVGRFRTAADLVMTPIELLRPIPGVAWIPLAILMFPTAESSMVYITFLGAFFPILLGTILGVGGVDRRLVQASMTLGAGPSAIFREVLLPGALPSILTGMSIGMGTAWFLLVTAEMISGQFGIGYCTWEAYTLQKYPDIVLGMAVMGVLGMGSSVLIQLAGRRLTPWLRGGIG
jgi:NitT/TauT family transport system permease protein